MEYTEKPSADVMQTLFCRYHTTRDTELRNEIVMSYSYIAKAIAGQMRGVASNFAQMEDIVNQGIITLIECVEKFDETKNVKFESFAFAKVKNSIIDFLRKQDFLPRRVRQTSKEIKAAEKALGNEKMREPTLNEVADYMHISPEQLMKYYGEISRASLVSLDELYHKDGDEGEDEFDISDTDSQRLDSGLFREEMRSMLIAALDTLTQRERTVISLYYFEKLKLHEIAKVLSVGESRVCQLHIKAINKLKGQLEEYIRD